MKTLLGTTVLLMMLVGVSLAGCGTTQAQTTPPPTSAVQTTAVQTITVTLTDTGVIASQTTFRPGVRCHFIVTNHGTRPHQFWLMPQGMAQMMTRADYTFTSSMMYQQLAFGCYTTDGQVIMEMPIRVKQH